MLEVSWFWLYCKYLAIFDNFLFYKYIIAYGHPDIFISDQIDLYIGYINYLKYQGPYLTLRGFFRTLSGLFTLLVEIQIIDNCLGDSITFDMLKTAIALNKMGVKVLSRKTNEPMINQVGSLLLKLKDGSRNVP